MPGGRPRTFDADAALDRAVEVFWRQGYEGASMTALTAAMGMNKPSIYATFGSKEELFRAAVARYAATDMAYAGAALEEPTAYDVVRKLLYDNVKALTEPGRPAGCLSIQGGISCSPENASVAEFLAASRRGGEDALAARLVAAVKAGDLSAGSEPAALARFVMTFSEGQAVHAAAGVSRSQLKKSADVALKVFAAS